MSIVEAARPQFDIGDVQLDDGTFIGNIQTVDECDRAMIELQLRISAIEGQIANAKHLAMASDQYADRVWWRKVNSALKINKAARQYVQNMRGTISRQEKAAKHAKRERVLIDALRAYVGEEVFASIVAKTE